ncbi:hypothetical protein ACFE04_014086 [Oxalis oulophora]
MADQHPTESSSPSNVSVESSESMVELNIKTLESQIHKFQVDKNIPVSAFKEKIANEIGVPVAQQRLIFRGKVLKDDHLLSEYHVENGHTLHLVARQLAQSQSESDSGETSRENSNRGGTEASAGMFPNRIGQISHSVVLGTFNGPDQGDGVAPDISRVIGAVLNSFGIGGQVPGNNAGGSPTSFMPNMPGQAAQGNESQGQAGSQSQSGSTNPSHPFQPSIQSVQIPIPFRPSAQGVQIPIAAGTLPIPSIQAPLPDSLTTIAEFMNRMEQAILQNGNPPNSPSVSSEDTPRVELPSNERGVPTPEALSIVLRRAQQLLSSHVTSALSHTAERLEQERDFSDRSVRDRSVRGQIQVEAMRLGLVMQHLGSLFLELGRAMMTLRMGQSSAESSVNAGPAVYISTSGPNTIMVHPFPLQTSPLFGGNTTSNSMSFAPVGAGSAPRNVNIHIHAGSGLAPVRSAAGSRTGSGQGERTNVTAVPQQSGAASSVTTQSGLGSSASQSTPDPLVTEINDLVTSMLEGNNTTSSGQVGAAAQGSGGSRESAKDTVSARNMPTSMLGSSNSESADGSENERVPLGLGLGNLGHKISSALDCFSVVMEFRRSKQPESQAGKSLDGQTSNQQQILQTLASGLAMNRPGSSNSSLQPGSSVQNASANAMSQALQSPALNGLLSGFSEQTGVGSPDMLRTMLQQFTQNPEIMNTVSQIAQQVDGQELEGMFSGRGGAGQGGGLDLSRMVQQMMPVVTRALSSGRTGSQSFPSMETGLPQLDAPRSSGVVDARAVAERIENYGTPENIFRAAVQNATSLYGNDSSAQDLIDELCSNPSLASEYVGLVQRDLGRRIQDESEQED